MLTARKKKKENIVEYLLYMWQVEDMIRACEFSIEKIFKSVIAPQKLDQTTTQQVKQWYEGLIRILKSEKKKKAGHISELNDLVAELFYLHNTLLKVLKNEGYIKVYKDTIPNILELQKKSNGKALNEIELCLTSLYGFWMLRVKKAPISDETTQAIKTISTLMAYLASHYKKMMAGEMNFKMN